MMMERKIVLCGIICVCVFSLFVNNIIGSREMKKNNKIDSNLYRMYTHSLSHSTLINNGELFLLNENYIYHHHLKTVRIFGLLQVIATHIQLNTIWIEILDLLIMGDKANIEKNHIYHEGQ